MRFRLSTLSVLCAAMLAAVAGPSSAQLSTGRIDASIADSTGAVLPGVTVDISGPQRQSAVTGNLGEAHFLNLAPGTYTVSAKLSGFADYLNKNIPVGIGASVPLKISLSAAGVDPQVQVTGAAPVVDTRKMGTSTNVSVDELQSIPSSRDPWVVLQTVPGVIVDRVNVGGAESGHQSEYQAKGASGSDNTWNIDGIAVTDMAAFGSPTYYDFDAFQEMQVTTGGADVMSVTPGVQLNMVLKSGSNTPHGSSRIYFENEKLQSNNMPANLAATIGGTTGKGSRMHQYKDYGFELGGPIVKNRLWAWGAAGKTHVDLITLSGTHDRTELQDTSFKATGQITPGIRANFTYFHSDKQKFGLDASPTRPPETTRDLKGPTPLYKGEGNFVFGSNMFVSAKAATTRGGFSLTAEGDPKKNQWQDDHFVWHDTFDTFVTKRPQSNLSVDANTFRGHHELKFGFGWRKATVDSTDTFPGNGIISEHANYPEMSATVKRDFAVKSDTVYTSAYGGDTWTRDRLTVNLGVRWDRQAGSLGAASVPASRALPTLLPALTVTPVKNAIIWNSVTPRVGFTYALDENRKTLARASYSMFASQLGSGAASSISTIQYSGIQYSAIDLNGNMSADVNELNLGFVSAVYGFDPLNPTSQTTVNKIGKYATPLTQEFMIGGDHELMSNFGLSATFTYRYYNHFDWNSHIGVNSSNYRLYDTLTGSVDPVGSFSTPWYVLGPVDTVAAGWSYEERVGYHQRFLGFEASAVKRLSNKWMARFGFSTNSHREYFKGADALDDPTPTPSSPSLNGGLVVTQTGGSGKSNIYLVLPQYQFIANGMYQAPWGVNLGANWLLRQGYAEPYFSPVSTFRSGSKDVLITNDVGKWRLPAVSSLDLRLEKAFKIHRGTIALDLDAFNVGNRATVLGRDYNLFRNNPLLNNQVLEIMNPRILRLGARITF
jgi:hypothetical protein